MTIETSISMLQSSVL